MSVEFVSEPWFGFAARGMRFVVPTSGWYAFGNGGLPQLLTDEEVRALGFDPAAPVLREAQGEGQ